MIFLIGFDHFFNNVQVVKDYLIKINPAVVCAEFGSNNLKSFLLGHRKMPIDCRIWFFYRLWNVPGSEILGAFEYCYEHKKILYTFDHIYKLRELLIELIFKIHNLRKKKPHYADKYEVDHWSYDLVDKFRLFANAMTISALYPPSGDLAFIGGRLNMKFIAKVLSKRFQIQILNEKQIPEERPAWLDKSDSNLDHDT